MVGEVVMQSLEGIDLHGQVQEGCCLWLHGSLGGMGGCCTSCMAAWEGFLASACVVYSLGAGAVQLNQVEGQVHSLSLPQSVSGESSQIPHTQEV